MLSVVFLVKKKIFAYVFITGCWSLVAIANGIVLSDRKTPFTAVDLTLVKSVLPILSSYLEVWQIVAIVILLVIGVGGLVCLTSIRRRIRSLKVLSPDFYIQQLQ